MAEVFALHHKDLEEGYGEIYIPEALLRKYPGAAKKRGWQWLFPSRKRSIDPRSGREMRHHVMESGLQKAVKRAAGEAGIAKKVSCHTLRHSFEGLTAFAYLPPFTGKRGVHSHVAGSARACRCEDKGNLYPCHEP